MKQKIKVGITHGDTNGIGYEIILKAFASPEIFDLFTPVLYGSDKVASHHRKVLGLTTGWHTIEHADEAQENRLNLIDVVGREEVKIELGHPSAEAGRMARLALEAAVADAKAGRIDVLVTCPIDKSTTHSSDFPFAGHTEYFQAAYGQKALMVLLDTSLRVALATTHLPVSRVAEAITAERIEEKLRQVHHSLRRDFGLSAPRIAVLGLNPHCGDGGLLGAEEETVIRPLLRKMNEEGMPCFGPYSADGFFGAGLYRHFDAILAMYHDQGLAPFKTLAMAEGVNFTAGLDLVRTSPDHGVAYDIAGKGQASPDSLLQSIYTAIDIVRHRRQYDHVTAHPLPFAPRDRREGRRSET